MRKKHDRQRSVCKSKLPKWLKKKRCVSATRLDPNIAYDMVGFGVDPQLISDWVVRISFALLKLINAGDGQCLRTVRGLLAEQPAFFHSPD